MAKILLTDRFLQSAKAAEKTEVLSDLRTNNLSVCVFASGKKSFVWRGRVKEKTVTLTLGEYGVHTLADAREWADNLARDRDNGIDIRAAKAATKAAVAAAEIDATRTVDACFEVYFKHDGGLGKDAAGKRAKYEREVRPMIGHRLISDITFDDLSDIIADKAERFPGAANKLHALIARMWKWLAMHPLGRRASGLQTNVFAGAFSPSQTAVKNTFLSDDAVRWLYRALDEEPAAWRHFYKLTLLTGTRRGEISDLRWSQIRGGAEPCILLMSQHAKNDRVHMIPISPHAMIEIDGARKLAGKSKFVFPADGDPEAARSISGFSKNHHRVFLNSLALAHFENPGAPWDEILPYWTLHDFRRTMRTWMSREENKIDKHVAEAIISHTAGKSKLDATYDMWDYASGKRRALTMWGERVAELTA